MAKMVFDYATLFKALRLTFSRSRFSLKSAAYATGSLALLLCFRLGVMAARRLDSFFFSGYQDQEVRSPVYIIANPRSGTTFLHRLMSLDDQFVSFRLYHTLFPAITLYRLIQSLADLNKRLGCPFDRIIERINHGAFDLWTGIHETRLEKSEEDEQLFLYTMLSPSMLMFFPFPDELDRASFVDNLPAGLRGKLMAYYKDCIRRFLFMYGKDKTLLAKNVFIQGRLQSIRETFPDMRIIHIVRHPYETIPSFISMYGAYWDMHSPGLKDGSPASLGLAKLLCRYYRCFLRVREELPADRFIEVRYEELIADPESTVERIYRRLNLPMSGQYRNVLKAETARSAAHRSGHKYTLERFGLTKEMIYNELQDVFAAYGFIP